MNKKVLILTGAYIPGVKAGGPIKSIKNIVSELSKDYDFDILTSNRDVGDKNPYSNVLLETWENKVYYVNSRKISIRFLLKTVKKRNPSIIYINSFFSFRYSILPLILLKLCLIKVERIVVAPRGQFSKGALSLKSIKKKIYLKVFNIFIVKKSIVWQATSNEEVEDIREKIIKPTVILAKNIVKKEFVMNTERIKKPGTLNIIFLSRISPKKNLLYAIGIISQLKGDIKFDIYGPKEDIKYWGLCLDAIDKLPDNISCSYSGIVNNVDVNAVFSKYHVFLFPTLGENFGHVIFESINALCPVILSDKTPWNDLEKYSAGWTLSLSDNNKFVEVLTELTKMNQSTYDEILINLSTYITNYQKQDFRLDYYKLFC